jgi:acyl-CoA dehydrogenase
MRRFTLGALDKGIKPPVITAIAKHYSTEIGRKVVNDAMDIMGGAGISMGPRNLIAEHYISAPIGITVEGANILTRTLMIFGQGALRAHPFAFKEIDAVEKNDLQAFDRAFWGHIGHIVRNVFRAFLLSVSRSTLGYSPVSGPTAKYWRRLAWASASFAITADIAMGALGGKLKIKEKITGRFADILGWMYIAAAVMRRWEADGRKQEDFPFVSWSLRTAFGEMDKAFDGIYLNLEVPGLSWFFRIIVRSWSSANTFMSTGVSDNLSHVICQKILNDQAQRERLTADIFIPKSATDSLGRLERAFKIIKAAEAAEAKIRKAIKAKKLPKVKKFAEVADQALQQGIIDNAECENLKLAEEVRADAIQVDSFSQEEYMGMGESNKANLKRIS